MLRAVHERKHKTYVGSPVPNRTEVQTIYRPETADWRTSPPVKDEAFNASMEIRRANESNILRLCPLPIFTHTTGVYFIYESTWDEAISKTNGKTQPIVIHANYMKGIDRKIFALKKLSTSWALLNAPDSESALWPQNCRSPS